MKKFWMTFWVCMSWFLVDYMVAYAQEPTPEFTLEEIVVTAERRETSAQDTPVAVTAWDSETLDEQNIGGIMDLQMRMPSTFISNDRVAIRGVGRTSVLLGTDPGVGIFTDGFYDPESREILTDLFDVERIENVRGPQSTLYGKSTIGGAINIIEKKPTKDWSGQIKTTIGNYERRDFYTAFGGPMMIDNLYYRVVLMDKYYGGHFKNVTLGEDEYIGSDDRWRMAAKLLFEPTDYLDVYLKYNVTDVKSRPQATATSFPVGTSWTTPRSSVIPALTEDYSTFYAWIGEYGYGSYYRNPYYGLTGENPTATDPYTVAMNTAPHRGLDTKQVDLTTTLDLGNFTIKYLTMYRDWDLLQYYDYDCGPNPDGSKIQVTRNNSEEFSHELQIQYGGEDSRFSAIGGLYYYDLKRSDIWTLHYYGEEVFWEFYYPFEGLIYPGVPTGIPAFTPRDDNVVYGLWHNVWDVSEAVYLQVNYDLTDTLTLSLGGRYAVDMKKGDEYRYYMAMWTSEELFDRYVDAGAINQATADLLSGVYPGPFVSSAAAAAGAGHEDHFDDNGNWVDMTPGEYLHNGFPYEAISSLDHEGDWAEWLFHIGLDWKPQETTTFYGKIDRGYKPGGFGLTTFQETNFDSEFCLAYEAGWKQMWMGNRFNTQLSGFYYDYTDMQQTRRVGHEYWIDNATEATNYGVEVEGTGFIIENLLASVSYSWLIAEFDEYTDVYDQFEPLKGDQDLSGNTQAYSPEHKITIQGTYTLPTGIGDFSAHALYFWQSEVYMEAFNIPERLCESYDRMDAELMWSSPAYTWRVTLWVKNIIDEEIIRYQTLLGPENGFADAKVYAPPRQFGFDISYKW